MITIKPRYIALSDINKGPDIDDIQSLIRLLLYSNEIDIEGIILSTSCFLKKPNVNKNRQIVFDVIEAYSKVRDNLLQHMPDYPTKEYLLSVVKVGIPIFGKGIGDGYAEDRWDDNEGVRHIVSMIKRDDDRPLWFGLWG